MPAGAILGAPPKETGTGEGDPNGRLERKIAELRGWVLLLVGLDALLFVMVLTLLIR